MAGAWTCPIYYRGAVSVEKGSVIIRYKLPELIKKFLRRGNALLQGGRTLLSRSHVPSMTGGCTCPIYYQGVVSFEKGGVIMRYKLADKPNRNRDQTSEEEGQGLTGQKRGRE
jgi:hypothetical protein